METVFEINLQESGVFSTLLLLKVLFGTMLSVSLLLICIEIAKNKSARHLVSRVYVALFLGVFGLFFVPDDSDIKHRQDHILKPFYTEKHEVTEGVVKVLVSSPNPAMLREIW